MSELHPAIIKAASLICGEKKDAEGRARRVIFALAEHMPKEAIEAAKATGLYATTEEVSAAIAAFLKHVGEM